MIRLRHEDSERNARIAQELEARKRDEAEHDARIAQEVEAQKREEAERDFEDDMRCRVAMHQLEMQQKDELQQFAAAAEVQWQQRSADNDNAEHYVAAFRVEQATKLIPKWDEGDVDTFIRTFERIAEVNGWPEDKYVAIMQQHFSTKAHTVFLSLPVDTAYDVLKEQLLLTYDIVPEWHRKKF